MKVIIWGSTGSLPAPLGPEALRKKIVSAFAAAQGRIFSSLEEIESFVDNELPFIASSTYSGNTSCVELRGGYEHVLLDGGSGLRNFGHYAFHRLAMPSRFHIFLSHLHWDHIQGIPFFLPAFFKGNRIDFYGCHPDFPEALKRQQEPPYFPVTLDYLQSEKHFHLLEPDTAYDIAGYRVRPFLQDHPGESYGYCFERNGKKIVYSTDSEHRDRSDYLQFGLVDFAKDADLLIFDAQYSLHDAIGDKASWGHSSSVIGVEIAATAGVKHLCLFHSEHTDDDVTLEKTLQDARQYALQFAGDPLPVVSMAYDGLEIDV